MKQVHNTGRPMLLFKRWSRKSFAIFFSLNKQIKIGVLSVTITGAWGQGQEAAQHTEGAGDSTIFLQEVLVSGDHMSEMEASGKVVTTLAREGTERVPAGSVSELLDFHPTLDIRQRGASDVQADISIRGGSFDQNMIMLNGINISNPHTGHNTLNLPIDIGNIDKIEVIEGAGAKLYGFNAFSGAINIVTGLNKAPFQFSLTGGDFGYFQASMATHFKIGRHIGNYIAASHTRAEGHTKNTDFNVVRFFYQGKWQKRNTGLEWMTGYTNRAFGANSFYTPKYPDQFEATSTRLASIKFFTRAGKVSFDYTAYWLASNDRFELFRSNPATWYQSHNYHQTDVLASQGKLSLTSGAGTTTLLAELRNEAIKSNVLGVEMSKAQEDNNFLYVPTRDATYTHGRSRLIKDATLSHEHRIGNLTMRGTVMAIHTQTWRLYPGFGVDWHIQQNHTLFMSVNKSMRLPTFTDLYYKGPSQESNPDLVAEEAITYDFSYRYKTKLFTFYGSIYHRRGKNLIDWLQQPDEEVWRAMNVASLHTVGAAVQGQLNFKNGEAPSFIESMSLGYNYLDRIGNDQIPQSGYVLNYLAHKVTARIVLTPVGKWLLTLGGYYQQRVGTYKQYVNTALVDDNAAYKPVLVCNAKLSYPYKRFLFFVDTHNLFNQAYYDFGNVMLPGRWFKIGLRYQ